MPQFLPGDTGYEYSQEILLDEESLTKDINTLSISLDTFDIESINILTEVVDELVSMQSTFFTEFKLLIDELITNNTTILKQDVVNTIECVELLKKAMKNTDDKMSSEMW